MKKTDSQKFSLGLLMIIGAIIFTVLVYFIGSKQRLFGKTHHLYASFNFVSGLQTGNNVRYSGVNVGNVRRIEMVNDTTIVVEMIIDRKIFPFIRKDAIAAIGSDGLVGNMLVNLIPGSGNSAAVNDGDTLASFSKIQPEELLQTLSITNDNIVLLSDDLLKITRQITEGKGTIGMLLNDTSLATNIKESVVNIRLATEQLNSTIGRVDKVIAELQHPKNVLGILKDTVIPVKINAIVDDVAIAGKELNQTIDNINQTVNTIKDGEGALNYLVNDPDLVVQIDSIMQNLHLASRGLNQNMEALKHNFLFRRYFKKLEKQQRRENR
jgi:phospholipid/cholesterol/gamma-HCH transport system substrate-binding protein